MKWRKNKQEKASQPAQKRRRLELKQERAMNQGAQEALEGVSYQADSVPRGDFHPVKLQSGDPTFITVDLETTGLIRCGIIPHITQIAAYNIQSGSKFNTYAQPRMPITMRHKGL